MLVEKFEGQFTCLGENTEKSITFSVPIEKEVTRIDYNEKEITKTLSYKLQFIDRARFMKILLLISLKDSIKLNVNTDTMIKDVRHVKLNTKSVIVVVNT